MLPVPATDGMFSPKKRNPESFDPTTPQGIRHYAEKQKVVKAAFECIEDGDTIALDASNAAIGLACLIGRRRALTVVTNNFLIARILENAESVNTILLGGTVLKGFHCTVTNGKGVGAPRLSVDKAFITAASFSLLDGAATPDIRQAKAKKTMMAMASKVYLMCDSSKTGKAASAPFARSSEIQTLITDRIAPLESRTLQKQGIEVIVAGTKPKRALRNNVLGRGGRGRRI